MKRAGGASDHAREAGAGFPEDLLFRAASMYYLDNATQAEVATAIGTSRATVSRVLAQARARGIVSIEVRPPRNLDTEAIARDLRAALGLKAAWVTSHVFPGSLGRTLAPGVTQALRTAQLRTGDAVLVSSGETVYEVAQQGLPALPGVVMAPTCGGQNEPEAYYQTNEITRALALKTDSSPAFLYAPAMPGPDLHDLLVRDPEITRILQLWSRARFALLGIGGPPLSRKSLPSVLPADAPAMQRAVGDICMRPFDRGGRPVEFPGSDRLLAMELADLRNVEYAVGVAVGITKIEAIRAAAAAGYVNCLVTDSETALALIEAVRGSATA